MLILLIYCLSGDYNIIVVYSINYVNNNYTTLIWSGKYTVFLNATIYYTIFKILY